MSLGQLLQKGYNIHMKDHSPFIRDDKRNLIMKVKMSKNRMFSLNIQKDDVKCLKTCYEDAYDFGIFNFGISILEDWSYYLRRIIEYGESLTMY